MTRLNYNRPNGGYTKFRTAKELPDAAPVSRTQRRAWATQKRILKAKQKELNRDPLEVHGKHAASVRGIAPRYVLWCNECGCEIQALDQEQYQIWRELNPPIVRRVK